MTRICSLVFRQLDKVSTELCCFSSSTSPFLKVISNYVLYEIGKAFWTERNWGSWWPSSSGGKNPEGFNLGLTPWVSLSLCSFSSPLSVLDFKKSYPELYSTFPIQSNSLRSPWPSGEDYLPRRVHALLIPATLGKWKGTEDWNAQLASLFQECVDSEPG